MGLWQAQHLRQHLDQAPWRRQIQWPRAVRIPCGAVAHLTGEQRAHSCHRPHQPLRQQARLFLQRGSKRCGVQIPQREPVLRWRGHIWLPGEKHTVAIQAGGHPPRTLENHATRIHQDQVAQAPHDLTHQIDSALLAGKRKTQHALECRLRDAGETRALNALAQE